MAFPLARALALGLTAAALAAAAPGAAWAAAPGAASAAAPPVLSTVQWTLRVPAGAPAAFSAEATDPDGDAVTLAWAFDDGSTAAGSPVTKVWDAPGVHTARVTATDATGRRTSRRFTVEVLPAGAAALGAPPAAVRMPRPGPAPVARASTATTVLRLTTADAIAVSVRCAPGADCAGTVAISRGGRRLAAAPYRVAAGRSRTVVLRVPAAVARALRRRRGHAVAIMLALAPARGPAARADGVLRLR
jgi:hypothetical protein